MGIVIPQTNEEQTFGDPAVIAGSNHDSDSSTDKDYRKEESEDDVLLILDASESSEEFLASLAKKRKTPAKPVETTTTPQHLCKPTPSLSQQPT